MFIDRMMAYVLVNLTAWIASLAIMVFSILEYNLVHFFIGFAVFWLYPILFETILNIYGCLTSSSLRRPKHVGECEAMCQGVFPIIYSHNYNAGLLGFEKLHGLDHKLPFYIYRKIEEEEIIDSKPEQKEWEVEERERAYEQAIQDAKRKQAQGKGKCHPIN
jgi:hypothetical protein